jgi:Mrp family chromosome partitioning ATPase
MERIQRALEFARVQRAAFIERLPASRPPALAPAPALPPPAPTLPEDEFEGGTTQTAAPETPPQPALAFGKPRFLAAIDRARLRESRIVFPEDRGPAAHAYRMLRTQIIQQAVKHDLRVIGVVSAVNGEGKTLTAINLALSLAAEPSQEVVLCDLDLRNPCVAKELGLAQGRGLESYLAGDVDLGDVAVGVVGVERLSVLPCFKVLDSSSQLLASARGKEMLGAMAHASAHGGARGANKPLFVVDLPAALLREDVFALAPLLDGVIVVASAGRTQRADVAKLQQLLQGCRILATVLNCSEESERRVD